MYRLSVWVERFIIFVSTFSFPIFSFWWVQSQLPPILSHKKDGRLGPSRSNCSARCRKSFDFAAMSFSMFSPVRVQRFKGYASHTNSMVIKMLGYVHKPSIPHLPKLCKSARRKLAFLHGKSNAHFISVAFIFGLTVA